jgi:KRAB domain-containing zinc finger protein
MTKFPRKEANPQEKSTRELVKFQFGKRKHSSENDTNKRFRAASNDSDEEIDIESDFTVPKKKQVAMKSTSGANVKNLKNSNLYFLGGDLLHKKLQPCFTKEEDEPIFQCVMCGDVFEDKYTLHKHILEHMEISFYKCKYCDIGELEISAMVTHIQKMHRKPIQHTRIDLEELEDEINRAIHSIKAKEYWGDRESFHDEKPILNVPIISPSVSPEPDVCAEKKEPVNALSPIILKQPKLKEKVLSTPEKNKLPKCVIAYENGFKCTMCNQQAIQSYILVRHAMTHCSRKRYLCPYCDKRSHYKSDICKHLHIKHKGEEFCVTYDKTDIELDAEYIAPNLMKQILDTPDEDARTIRAEEEEQGDVKVEIKDEEDCKVTESNDRKGKKVVVGFRSVYKCLLCKLTMKGKGNIYKHIRETKCKRPLWRCSACKSRKFKSDKEKVIKDHIKDVHQMTGDAKPVLCAINGKIRKHTMPITITKHEEEMKKIQKSEEFASEETIKEKESSGAEATVVKRGDLWQCSNCSYETHSRANCIRHTFTHSLYKKFGCPVCSFRAKCSRGVKNHMRNCHPRERIRFKIYTEISSSPKKSIQKDETERKEKLPVTSELPVSFQCQECGFISERKSSLSKHINAKCFTPLKGCSECDFTSINQEEMAKHIKNSHKTATVNNLPLSNKIITLNTGESEKYCKSPIRSNDREEKRYKDRFQLKVKPSVKSSVSKPLSTEMKMWSKENARQTMKCPACNGDFDDLRAFRDHFVNEHKGIKLLCGECEEYAAHLPSLLFRHARLFHNQTRLVDLKLTAISKETIHEKGLDQRPVILYKCPKCEKISERCPLRRHIYTHYNYNPYHCNHCDMKCKMQKNIRDHLSKIHPDKSWNEYTFRKNAKLEKEISDILDRSRYQTLTRKTKMSVSFSRKGESKSPQLDSKVRVKREALESENKEDGLETEDEEEGEEEESEEEEDDEPRGDLKNMFSPCHNYKVEFDNRRQKTIYKCSICPYQSTVNKTMVTHFYHHVPHVFKCPYCDFQCYPR